MSNYELVFPYNIRLLFKVGQAWTTSTFRSQVICVKLWISIPIQASADDWLALSWLVNVGWSVILASYHHVLQLFSTTARFVRAPLEFCIPWDFYTVIFAVSKAWLMSSLHCVLNWEVFCIDFCCFLSIINVTVINLRFLYFSVCLQSVQFFFQNLVAIVNLVAMATPFAPLKFLVAYLNSPTSRTLLYTQTLSRWHLTELKSATSTFRSQVIMSNFALVFPSR